MPADLESGDEAARRHFEGAEPWDPDQEWGLRMLVDALRARAVPVVLVRYPLSAGYLEAAHTLGADDGTRRDALFAELAAGGGVRELDFERAFVDRPELFADGDHLNVDGKRTFTALLARALFDAGLLTAPRWEILKRPVMR
jgi:lysophospholipase L1-like esterase